MATLATLGQTKLGHRGHHPEGVAKLVAGHALGPGGPAVSRGPGAPTREFYKAPGGLYRVAAES